MLADLTCDSDGKVDRFVDRRDVKQSLELHEIRTGERYVLAVALVGAYQEILGDMHNLFGDTNAVHISVDEDGEYTLDEVVEGDKIETTLGHVQYNRRELVDRVRRSAEQSIRMKRIARKEAAMLLGFINEGLSGYTYLGS